VGWQLDAADLPGAAAPAVRSGDALPEVAALGTLFVLGDCDALYQSDGTQWTGVERTRAAGQWTVTLEPASPGNPVGLVARAARSESGPDWRLSVLQLGDGQARFGWRTADGARTAGRAFSFSPDVAHTFDVLADPNVDEVRIVRDGVVLLGASGAPAADAGGLQWGRNALVDDDSDRFEGRLTIEPDPSPELCRRVQPAR
jgi:hypothetical protein